MKILLSGSSGLIGSYLKERFESDNHVVISLPRTYEDPIDFSGVKAVIHLAGESIATGRWTKEKKKKIENSRVSGTRQLSEQIRDSASKPDVFICASAIGYYGDRGNEILDEASAAGEGFLAEVCKKWESAATIAETAGIRTIRMRTGIVLSSTGGALKRMLPPFKLGAGGRLGTGRQYMSWISLEDMIAIIRYLVEDSTLSGPINLVSPNPVTNKEFTMTLGSVLNRPTFMPIPSLAAKMLFGEMADALLLASARVMPTKLIDAGYEFKYPTLRPALESILL